MEITTELIKSLRDKTGVSVMQCKKALEEAGGDMDKAVIILLKHSKEAAIKKEGRELGAGVVEAYIHNTKTVGALVELQTETDFVANNDEFRQLAKDLAMHVAASSPEFIKSEDVTEADKVKAREVFLAEIEETSAGKSAEMKEKILNGKLDSFFNERVLLEQPFVKNQDILIKDMISQAIQKFGEKVAVGRFVRYSIK